MAPPSSDAGGLPPLSQRIARVLALDRDAPALEFEGTWHTWGELAAAADAVGELVSPGERVAVLLRNRPHHAGLLVGLLAAGACVVTVNPERGDDRVRADLADLNIGTVAGEQADLERFATRPDPTSPSGRGIRRDDVTNPTHFEGRWLVSDSLGTIALKGPSLEGAEDRQPGVAVEMLTSGTTGVPKRVPLTYETFSQVLAGAKHYERNPDADLRLRSGVAIINAPLVHVSGVFRVIQCVADGRSFCLLDRFRVEAWVDAVRRHQPKTASLVPTALRMVLDADLDPADLSSIRSVISGTAPLDPADADAFFVKYGIAVLISYGATEFGGGVAGWNLKDHEQFWSAKRGSVGRAHPGCELRVVDPASDEVLGPDEDGLLEVKARQIGDGTDWTRTTDLARVDPDGFLWILGRSDQTIIRGGFKVQPDTVRKALERDPRVRGAAVIGRPDRRLGEVPVAAVELRDNDTTADDLTDGLTAVLARYEVPAEVLVVESLPRTPSGKVDLSAVRDLFADEESG